MTVKEYLAQTRRITPTQEVHHVKPLAQGGTNDNDNLTALCTSCHSEITAREGGRWQRCLE